MRKSVVSVLAVAGLVLASSGLSAQQQPGERTHSLIEDAWALQFGVSENFTLGTFAGGVISAKHQRADGRALRYGLTVSAGHESGRDDRPDATNATVGLVVHFLRYPTLARDPGSNLHMFWGVGPLGRYQTQRVSRPDQEDTTLHLLTIGAGGTIGAEWFVRERLSLSAEYQTALRATFHSEPSPNEWAIRIAPEGVKFGASVYFP